jgi:isopropylmalate/homocitrate/citramalate synthase
MRWSLSPYNEALRAGMALPPSVQITDLTLREGRQVGGVWLELDDVREYARRAAEIGISVLEMHHSDPDEIRAVKALGLDMRVQALVHPTAALSPQRCREEIDACLEVGTDTLSLALAISDHNTGLVRAMAGLDITREEIVANACEALAYARSQGADVGVILMDFTRLELSRLEAICADVAAAGASHIRLDDICAPCLPAVVGHHVRAVKAVAGEASVAIHTHDDFGLALASQRAALEAGASILEGSMTGLGERAGLPDIAALASVVELMYGLDTGIRLDGLQDLAAWVASTWNQPIPPHRPVIGDTAFSHAVEVHYVMDEGISEWAWNAWGPDVVGNAAHVPLCKYSGPYAVRAKARDLGLPGDFDAAAVVAAVREELRCSRTDLSDERFAAIVAGEPAAVERLVPGEGVVPPDHVDSVSRPLAGLPGLKVNVCSMAADGHANPHAHAGAHQILFVTAGELEVEGVRVPVGEAAYVPPGVAHAVTNPGPGTAHYLAITVAA